MLRLVIATEADIPVVQDIMAQATSVKENNGDDIWSKKPYSYEEVQGYIEDGLQVAWIGDTAVGSVVLADSDERMWGDAGLDESALYIHKLARVNQPPVRGLGGQIIDLCGAQALARGRSALRLDCETSNIGLVGYYRDRLGFSDMGQVTVDSQSRGKYQATLFESQLG